MSREATSTERYGSYAPVGMIRTSWDGVNWVRATFAVVGINDILTVQHALYRPDLGTVKYVELYPAADYNAATGTFEDKPFQFQYSNAQLRFFLGGQAFADSDHTTVTFSEAQYDWGLIGLPNPIGRDTGWLGTNAGHNGGVQTKSLGYPAGATGMTIGDAYAVSHGTYGIYTSTSSDALSMGGGSSGGPLLVGNEVIGVKSGVNNTTAVFADLGLVYSELVGEISYNDYKLGQNSVPTAYADWLIGSEAGDTIAALAGNDAVLGNGGNDVLTGGAGNDELNGGAGRDTAVFSGLAAQYSASRDGSTGYLTVKANAGTDGTDLLINIERLQFANGTLALDTDGPAGQAYRMYKAAFDRTPDQGGLSFWIKALDAGQGDLIWMANFFANSTEFVTTYGALSTASFVNRLYNNVLDRNGDAGGIAFWQGEIDAGRRSRAQVLADFSESTENQANVIGVIENGIWFV